MATCAANLLILVPDERMYLCVLKSKPPRGTAAPAPPNHSLPTSVHPTGDAVGRKPRRGHLEEETPVSESMSLLSCLEDHGTAAEAMRRGIEDLAVLENTHLPLKRGNVTIYFFSRHQQHKSVLLPSRG